MRGLGEDGGRATGALITDMDQPLADAVGNASEVVEAIEVLRGERAGRFTDLCVALAGHMAALAGLAEDADAGRERAAAALASGAALERFRRFVEAQGGDPRIVEDASLLPQAPVRRDVRAGRAGWLAAVDAEAVGRAAARVGAGRLRKDDEIDLAVGIDSLSRSATGVDADTVWRACSRPTRTPRRGGRARAARRADVVGGARGGAAARPRGGQLNA